ncbi:hypothetical protein XBP1_1160004 [Xenorhabdus bovienii str. puntauvense]|uniref:Uncharacterized protein n=1 Tax=Xenorhabdus bovienii str. puntauvense TaxID=1398201 RepID=A0A077MZM9_XENBV|nr:hypothetical protein XBP1_1160004 [Xenorhabdus bovienii str. puntauvense]
MYKVQHYFGMLFSFGINIINSILIIIGKIVNKTLYPYINGKINNSKITI